MHVYQFTLLLFIGQPGRNNTKAYLTFCIRLVLSDWVFTHILAFICWYWYGGCYFLLGNEYSFIVSKPFYQWIHIVHFDSFDCGMKPIIIVSLYSVPNYQLFVKSALNWLIISCIWFIHELCTVGNFWLHWWSGDSAHEGDHNFYR